MNPRDHSAADEIPPPQEHESLWMATTPSTSYDRLEGDVDVDVAVVGGGIAGLTTALLLAESGREVAILERDRIVEGVTGRTTAKVTSQHGVIYRSLLRSFGAERARQYAQANQRAVEHVAERVDEHDIDCRFRRVPAYVYTEQRDERRRYREEADAARRLGLPASYVDDVPLPADVAGAVRFDDQAEFDPRAYLLALAEAFVEAGGDVYESTTVRGVDAGSPCRVTTDRGEVAADDVVLATHFPLVDDNVYFARMYPKRSYVLAARVADPPRDGMFYRAGESYFSVRTHEVGGGDVGGGNGGRGDGDGCGGHGETLTLVGGQNHKTGQGGKTSERYRRLESLARDHFDVESIEYRWSTQDYVSVDRVPYVGETRRRENVYVATGFGGWGMSNGTAAGAILADRIRGRENPFSDVFSPSRFPSSADTVRELATENANVGRQFVADWATKPRKRYSASAVADLAADEATVFRDGNDVLGAYRDGDGELHGVSAVCPHLYCIVDWNDGEKTWDCPCHGSRFTADGDVIDGPATRGLSPQELDSLRR